MNTPRRQDCLKYFERISEWLDGELDRQDGEKLKTHIESCPQCRACWATFRASVDIFKSLGPEPVPPDFLAELKALIRRHIQSDRGRW